MCLHIVLWHPLALVIHEAQAVLSNCVSLFGGFAVPTRGFSVVLRNSLAVLILQSEAELSVREALVSGSSVSHADGAAHLGVWHSLLMVASRAKPRGQLVREDGRPHTPESLALVTRLSEPVVRNAIDRLLQIGLLESSEAKPCKRKNLASHPDAVKPQDTAPGSQDGAAEGICPMFPVMLPQRVPTPSADETLVSNVENVSGVPVWKIQMPAYSQPPTIPSRILPPTPFGDAWRCRTCGWEPEVVRQCRAVARLIAGEFEPVSSKVTSSPV